MGCTIENTRVRIPKNINKILVLVSHKLLTTWQYRRKNFVQISGLIALTTFSILTLLKMYQNTDSQSIF